MKIATAQLGDFRNYLHLAWRWLGLPRPTRLQYDVAYHMQHGPRRLCIMAFRGFGKSWIASTFGTWRIRIDPDRKFLQTSAAKKRADDAVQFMHRMFNGFPVLRDLRPRVEERDSMVEFDVYGIRPAHQPSVRSIGLLSSIMQGSRCDDFVADDVETKRNSITILMRERVQEAFKELGGSIIRSATEVRDPRGIVLGTPQVEESLYHTLEDRGYTMMIYPARYPNEEQLEILGNHLAPILRADLERDSSLVGKPTEPSRFGEAELQDREREYGRLGFQMQFMLMPQLADEERHPLKLRDLVVTDLDEEQTPGERILHSSQPHHRITNLHCVGFTRDKYYEPRDVIGDPQPYQDAVLAIDPAGKGKDELGWCVVKSYDSQLFLLACGGYIQGFTERNLERLAQLARKYRVNAVITETNFGGGMFSSLLQPVLHRHHPCRLVDFHSSTRKEQRMMDVLEPLISNHRLIVSREAVSSDYRMVAQRKEENAICYSLFYQMSRLAHDGYGAAIKDCLEVDDRLDALSMAADYFAERMAVDRERKMHERKREAFRQQLREYAASIAGTRLKQPTWVTT